MFWWALGFSLTWSLHSFTLTPRRPREIYWLKWNSLFQISEYLLLLDNYFTSKYILFKWNKLKNTAYLYCCIFMNGKGSFSTLIMSVASQYYIETVFYGNCRNIFIFIDIPWCGFPLLYLLVISPDFSVPLLNLQAWRTDFQESMWKRNSMNCFSNFLLLLPPPQGFKLK